MASDAELLRLEMEALDAELAMIDQELNSYDKSKSLLEISSMIDGYEQSELDRIHTMNKATKAIEEKKKQATKRQKATKRTPKSDSKQPKKKQRKDARPSGPLSIYDIYQPVLGHHPALEYCAHLLDELMNHEYGPPFCVPVDPAALGIPHYFSVITNPMDLGTIKSRLLTKYYKSTQDFAEDVRLVWKNALVFNESAAGIHTMAQVLSSLFEEKVAKAFELEVSMPTRDHEVLRKEIVDLQKAVGQAKEEMKSLRRHGINWNKDDNYSTFFQSDSKIPIKPREEVVAQDRATPAECASMTEAIAKMDGEQLRGVVRIIEEEMPNFLPEDLDSVEIDVAALDPFTQTRLRLYVQEWQKATSK